MTLNRRRHHAKRQLGPFGAGSQHTETSLPGDSSSTPGAGVGPGAGATNPPDTNVQTTQTSNPPVNTNTSKPADTKTTKDPLSDLLNSLTNGGSSSSSSSSTPTSTSSTPTSTSSQSSSSSVGTTHSTSSAATPLTVLQTVTSVATSHSTIASATTSPEPDGSTGTGTLVGIIGGAIVGVAVLACIVAFLIRRWRRRQDDAEAFSASQFRRSAVVLDDDDDDPSPFAANPRLPRPPTMIERHVASTPSIPPATYSLDPNYPSYGHDQGFTYQQQQAWAPGEIMPSPISPRPEDQDATSPAPFLNRQPSLSAQYEQYHDHPHANSTQYVEMDRAAATPAPVSAPPAAAHPATLQPATKRPETIYDPEDAYGGM